MTDKTKKVVLITEITGQNFTWPARRTVFWQS
jgi:hypothetical protein